MNHNCSGVLGAFRATGRMPMHHNLNFHYSKQRTSRLSLAAAAQDAFLDTKGESIDFPYPRAPTSLSSVQIL